MRSTSPTGNGPGGRRRLLVLVNPAKRASTEFSTILARLAAEPIDIEVIGLDALKEDRGRVLATALASSAIVVSGGDGTLSGVADFLMEAKRPLGVLPTGTANDFARNMGIPVAPAQAAETIISGSTKTIDLGEVNGHYFFNVASIGMSVTLTDSLTVEVKRRWGRAAYAVTAARVALRSQPFSARITTPHEAIDVKTLQIAVGNGRYYGGGAAVDATATIDDGLLHLYSLEMTSPWALLPMLWSLKRGTHGRWASVRTLIDNEMEVRTRRPRQVTADGEIVTSTPCVFRVHPRALQVLAPAVPAATSATGQA